MLVTQEELLLGHMSLMGDGHLASFFPQWY